MICTCLYKHLSWPNNASVLESAVIVSQDETTVHSLRTDVRSSQHSHLRGNYIPGFCGGMSIGDWHELPHLLAGFRVGRYPPLAEMLIEHGPFGLFELAQQQYGYEPAIDGYTGECHLCVDVRRRLVDADDFAEPCPRGFYDNF